MTKKNKNLQNTPWSLLCIYIGMGFNGNAVL